jgi:pyridoxal phosphate enzyme (YggS family)
VAEALLSSQERLKVIAENIATVKAKIATAANCSGRQASDITLVVVTKTISVLEINTALACGIDIFAENRVQELIEKLPEIDMLGKNAHIIGHLQSNKVKQIIDKVDLIQSLDSLNLAAEIDRQAKRINRIMDVLIEVNIGGEQTKTGAQPKKVEEFIDSVAAYKNLHILGLMAIPPFCENKEDMRHYFAQMYKLFIDIKTKKKDNVTMQVLSMGMSSDFDVAIEEGSNMVRVGTAIFGKR